MLYTSPLLAIDVNRKKKKAVFHLLHLGEVLLRALGVGLHGGRSGRPVRRANLAVLVRKLEGLDEAQHLVDRAPDGQVVDGLLAEGAVGGDDEQAAERDAGVAALLDQHLVVARDLLGQVGEQRVAGAAQAALVAGRVDPREVREVRVDGAADDLAVEGLELGDAVAEGDDLGGADEGEVKGVEEEDEVLAALDCTVV